MNIHSQKFTLTGKAGTMECLLDTPEGPAIGIALVAHPHPLYGGTMENKVTQTLARTFVTLGYVVARFNFRGVGASEGVHDRGFGETDDMEVMLDHMQQRYPNLPVVLSGFSFGTFVQATLYQRLLEQGRPIERMVLVGTAAGKWPVPDVPQDSIVIHGEQDETITLTQVFDWARPLEVPVIVIPGADHFFHRKLGHIKNLVIQLWRKPGAADS
ncbi:alpha/beta hydrolase [Massilia soli]|uniref:Alpha/beta fold hydrolase n=1 Tax=Massilia soli TaxID=2792854 RepID=A0ABS7SMW1_9BURK|nr:alpha/beta fold hydrolase [Massilia soli]MBZ2206490.1 alpha/beta fold hydrolase [Massilia soli]